MEGRLDDGLTTKKLDGILLNRRTYFYLEFLIRFSALNLVLLFRKRNFFNLYKILITFLLMKTSRTWLIQD